jgi:formate-dependent nitrite reductase membrane component NrfD
MLIELLVIATLVVIAGKFVAPLFTGIYALLFWSGTVLLGLLIPLALNLFARRSTGAPARLQSWVVLASVLILLGGALLRISLITAGQA